MPEKKDEINSEVLKGCLKGELKSQELLYKQYYAYGMSICLRYSHNRDEAAEILNDSYLKVFTNIQKYIEGQPFKAWFRRIIINTSIDHYRKNSRHYNHLDQDVIDQERLNTDLIDHLDIDDLMKLLNQLPENYRLTFNLYEIEGYSHQEIAQLLGIAEGTSRSNLTRARYILRRAFLNYNSENICRTSLTIGCLQG